MTNFEKARIDIEGGSKLQCWFNPREYSVTKSNAWRFDPVVGSNVPVPQFGGGQARELSLDLMFDADPADGDVRTATDELFRMMEVDASLEPQRPDQPRPPKVTFAWGQVHGFEAVCTYLSVQFVLFRSDGTPIRAHARVTLVQVAEDARSSSGTRAPQNPTTRSLERRRVHVVRDGDSLQSIAWEHYRDATRWRPIAEANGIDDPLALRRGTSLSIPVVQT